MEAFENPSLNAGPLKDDRRIDLIMKQIVGVPRGEVVQVFLKNREEIVATIVELGMRAEQVRQILDHQMRRQEERNRIWGFSRK